MSLLAKVPTPGSPSTATDHEIPDEDDGNLTDLLGEARVLLSGVQTMTAFLIILPFNGGFEKVATVEKVVYGFTFSCSVLGLILLTAPAAYHRLNRPLPDRAGFNVMANRFAIAALVPLSVMLVLACQLVLSQVMPWRWGPWAVAAAFGVLILLTWWVVPSRRRASASETSDS